MADASVSELSLSLTAAPRLLEALTGKHLLLEEGAVRCAVLVEDEATRVRLAGESLPALVAAEVHIWRLLGESEADQRGWAYVDKAGVERGPATTAQLRGWARAGYFAPELPVRNGASTHWLTLGALLGLVARDTVMADAAELIAELSKRREDGVLTEDTVMSEAPLPPVSAEAVALIADTSVLLAAMPTLLRALQTLDSHAYLYITSAAVGELDGLKNSANAQVSRSARAVTRQLETLMAARHPGLRGQTVEAARSALRLACLSVAMPWRRDGGASAPTGDERILAAALSLQQGGTRVILLSDDVNLRLRASISGVPSVGAERTPSSVAELLAVAGPALQLPPSPPPQPARPVREPPLPLAAVALALQCIAAGCSAHWEALYRAEYGEMADVAVGEKAPFDGRACLRLMRKHWSLVFAPAGFPRSAREAGERLEAAAKGVPGQETAREAAGDALLLLSALPEGVPGAEAARAEAQALCDSLGIR